MSRRHLLPGIAALLCGAVVAAGAQAADSAVVFRFADADIVESSGLAVIGTSFVTINDSGDRGRFFVVDRSGATVGVTRWSGARPRDTEAVAPAAGGSVWVGDIGDNSATRGGIEVLRLPVRTGDRTVDAQRFALAYPDGPHNAEALLVHPGTGRLYIATKELAGASLYAAPSGLKSGSVNRLTRVAPVPQLVTDGAFTADGTHALLRTYGKVFVYGFPSLRLLASASLPAQPQGEGLAITADNTIYLSSEGLHSPVLRYVAPPRIASILAAGGRLDDAATATDAAPVLAVLGFTAAAAAAAAVGASLGPQGG